MSRYVNEIMNPELLALSPHHPAGSALHELLRKGISGAPVIDSDGRPLGMVSLRDLSVCLPDRPVRTCMSSPAVSIRSEATVLEAARVLGRTGFHRLVVLDEAGYAVGMLSSIDVIRALTALPVTHPATFPHFDEATRQVWSDPADLTLGAVMSLAPEEPGVLVLIHDPPGFPAVVVWAEAVENLSARLLDLVSTRQSSGPDHVLSYNNLRFRVATVSDPQRREVLIDRLRHNGRTRFGAAPSSLA